MPQSVRIHIPKKMPPRHQHVAGHGTLMPLSHAKQGAIITHAEVGSRCGEGEIRLDDLKFVHFWIIHKKNDVFST